MEYVLGLLPALVTQLLVISVWSIGIVASLIFWRRHTRVSLLTLIACAGFLIMSIVSAAMTAAIPRLVSEGGLNPSEVGGIFGIVNIISGFIQAILWILVLIAIFGWRKTPDVPDSR